jgi:hypothetical protein
MASVAPHYVRAYSNLLVSNRRRLNGRFTSVRRRPESTPEILGDLASPVFPPEALPTLANMEATGRSVTLDPDLMMRAAMEQTRLEDFGEPTFRPRLDLLCHSLNTEASLSGVGMISQFGAITALLKARLRLEALITLHPEIRHIEITRPIVLCGLPRTGSTHLHGLLAADPGLRSLPHWESIEPFEGPDEAGTIQPRRLRVEQSLTFQNAALPYLKRMHDVGTDHPQEDIQLLAIDFSSMMFEAAAPMPTWRDAYLARDQRPSYAYLKLILQALTWLRGGQRWVLKAPQHAEQLSTLLDTFPDATFVVTHREPVAVTASWATTFAYFARMWQASPDPTAIGRYWADRVEHMMRRCVNDRDDLPAGRTMDLGLDEYRGDEMAWVSRIYGLAEQPMTRRGRKAMRTYLAEHRPGQFGTVAYDLAPLGLDGEERRAALRFYADRFGV